jgi:hypothetical protein
VIAILFSLSLAHAGDGSVADNVGWARDAVRKGDLEGAAVFLAAAEAGAVTEKEPIPGAILARIWYLRGVVAEKNGDPEQEAIHLWRQTLVLDNDAEWDEELLASGEKHTLFEALRKEVIDRGAVDVRVPDKVGAAKLYVDGTRVKEGDLAIVGRHLAQITCPDGRTYGEWTEFDKKFKWLRLCPDGVDTSVVVTEQPDDETLGLLPDWEGTPHVTTDTTPPDSRPPDTENHEVAPPIAQTASSGGSGLRPLAFAGGGALFAVGLVLDLVWVNPTYADVADARANPATITRTEADEITAAFNTARWTTVGLLGGGLAIGGIGFLLDAHPAVVAGQPGMVVGGRF